MTSLLPPRLPTLPRRMSAGGLDGFDFTLKSDIVMVMTMTIGAGEFKARCLQLLDEVAESGESIVITKRGRPVAKLVPVEEPPAVDLKGSLVAEVEDAYAAQPELWGEGR